MFEKLNNYDIVFMIIYTISVGYITSTGLQYFLGIKWIKRYIVKIIENSDSNYSQLEDEVELIKTKLSTISKDIKNLTESVHDDDGVDGVDSVDRVEAITQSCKKVIDALEMGKGGIVNTNPGTLSASMMSHCSLEKTKLMAKDMDIQLSTGGTKFTKQELIEAMIKFANYSE